MARYGADLGNHPYSHVNINDIPSDEYTGDILRGEPVLRAALANRGKSLRYHRHPFHHTGATPEIRKQMDGWAAR